MPPESPNLFVVGAHDPAASWVPGGPRARASAALWLGLQIAAAAATVGLLAAAVTDERGSGLIELALAVGVLGAGGRAALSPRESAAGPTPRATAGLALVVAMLVAVAGEFGVWDTGPLDALLLSAGALASAAIVGLVTRRPGGRTRRILVVGTGDVARHLVSSLSRSRTGHVVGMVDDERLPPRWNGSEPASLGGMPELPELVAEHRIDLVIFTFVGTGDAELSRWVAASRAAGAEVAVVSRLFQGLGGSLAVRRVEGFPVVAAGPRGSGRAAELAGRATDVLLAAIALVLVAPLWLAVAVTIRLNSPGPTLYRAQRVGRDGVPFAMLKFRKMHEDAAGPALTQADDERFTGVGRVLAHTKLDELPQLWNVLRGQMSFVGPRPEDARYVEAQADAYRTVLTVRPGITGLSQICFRREFEHLIGDDFEASYLSELLPLKLSIDRYYVDHKSWSSDMRILFWTAIALLRGGQIEIDHLASHVAFRPRESRRAT